MVRDRVVELPPSVVNTLVGRAKFIERAETRHNKWDLAVFVIFRFEPFWAVGNCEMGQKAVVSTCRGGGLTLEDVGHLVRPPGYVSDEERWLLLNRLCLLIARSLIVDACHMALMHQLINRFGMTFWSCVSLRGSVGMWKVRTTNATHRASACAADGGRESHSRVLWQFSLCPVC